jgi:tetratricopeptide (TPR) repeat protein
MLQIHDPVDKNMTMPGRNEPCTCGSGKRYKHCCGAVTQGTSGNKRGVSVADQSAVASRRHAHAAFVVAHRAHGAGRKAEAVRGYRASLSHDPDYPEALHFLGMLTLEAGQHAQAEAMVARSLELKPKDADFWANAALVQQAIGRHAAAVDAYRASLRLAPADAERWMFLGSLLLLIQDANASVEALSKAVSINPKLGQAWFLLGNALMKSDSEDMEAAVNSFQRALKFLPGSVELRISLSTALAKTEQLEAAREMLEQAVQLEPGNAKAWSNFGLYWLNQNNAEQAVACYERMVELDAGSAEPLIELGVAHKTRGDFAAAGKCFERALVLKPGHLAALAQHVDNVKFDSADAPLLCDAMRQADEAADHAENLVSLCFTLGKVLDKLGSYDKAFAYYARGNRIKRDGAPFNPETYAAWVSRRIGCYDANEIAALKNLANPTTRPIFILGMPRSGTTLTEQILSSHTQVAGGGERSFWPYADRKFHSDVGKLDHRSAGKLVDQFLAELDAAKGVQECTFVTDKMPDNFKRIGMLHALMPNARFIHVRRHPVDNCLSIFFQNFSGHAYSRDLDHLAYYYREYRRLMTHWRSVIPNDRLYEIDYEDLVANQEETTKSLLAFCGLEWEPACLDFQDNERVVRTASIWQVRQKMYSSSVERWKNYAPHIAPLLSLVQE